MKQKAFISSKDKLFSVNSRLRFASYLLFSLILIFYFWLGAILFLNGCKPHTDLFSDRKISSELQENIADKVLRLHIIADSNSEADQQVKYQIRDAILSYIRPYLTDVGSKEEAVTVLNEHLPDFVELANRLLETDGFSYRAQVAIGKSQFPVKQYGDLILPAGEYDALKIRLGNADGKNWWCIVFPQLCFVDIVSGKLPDSTHEQMKDYLSSEEYAMVFPSKATVAVKQKSTPKMRFWFWERVIKKWEK